MPYDYHQHETQRNNCNAKMMREYAGFIFRCNEEIESEQYKK